MPRITKFPGPNGSTLYLDSSTTGPSRWAAKSNDDFVTLAVVTNVTGDDDTRTERIEFGFKIGCSIFGAQESTVAAAYVDTIAKVAEDAEHFADIIARTDAAFTPERARILFSQDGDDADSLEQVMGCDDVEDALRAIADQD